MRFKEIISRLTGISTPVFGASWQATTPNVTIARQIIIYLEDRRVLFAPDEVEVPMHCVESILDVRRFLTSVLSSDGLGKDLEGNIRAMRAACRKFLETVGAHDREAGWIIRAARERFSNSPFGDARFNQALGELRGVFGVHVGQIAVRYGLDVEDRLATILPDADEGELSTD